MVKLRQPAETIEKRARFRSVIEINLRTEETVPGIEDYEFGLGFLERILEDAESGVGRRYGSRRGGSTQDDEARGISVEGGEAHLEIERRGRSRFNERSVARIPSATADSTARRRQFAGAPRKNCYRAT